MMSERVERLTKRTVDAAKPGPDRYRVWDADIKGFGLKVWPSGVKTYVVWYRAGREQPRRGRDLHGRFVASPLPKLGVRRVGQA